ncbi:MAG TPA: hypothetical protein VHO02_00255 [Fibrobacteria bacterium]|jgi:hypothetical protein|nr:hypothetical protein [Fibrobacteria bacterium]
MTNAERDAFVNVKGQQSWEAFRARFEAAATLAEARRVADEGPRKPAAGWGNYNHLRLFLRAFKPPRGATSAERVLYRGFVQRLERAGELESKRAWEILESLVF